MSADRDFTSINSDYTNRVVRDIEDADVDGAVLVEAPPGAGKSSLIVSVARELISRDDTLCLPIVTQTNEQADDLVIALLKSDSPTVVARLHATEGPSSVMRGSVGQGLVLGSDLDTVDRSHPRIVVATARKWEYVRSMRQGQRRQGRYDVALIDEAYQMRSDALLGIAGLFDRLLCVGDPGQLAPFSAVDDSLWKGLKYSPSRTAMGTLRAFHPDIEPHQLPTSWRLPASAAEIVSAAFYPFSSFDAGTAPTQRSLHFGKVGRSTREDDVLDHAAERGWAHVQLPEKYTIRTDREIASLLARLAQRILERGADVLDEREAGVRRLMPSDVAVVAAHNDQVHSVRYELSQLGVDPDLHVISTANKIQGREYEIVLVWHPLAGRRDATAFHLEAGRMCVMLSRHRQACIVVGRAGASRLLDEFPDSEPVFLNEPEKFPDGWEANRMVLQYLDQHRVT